MWLWWFFLQKIDLLMKISIKFNFITFGRENMAESSKEWNWTSRKDTTIEAFRFAISRFRWSRIRVLWVCSLVLCWKAIDWTNWCTEQGLGFRLILCFLTENNNSKSFWETLRKSSRGTFWGTFEISGNLLGNLCRIQRFCTTNRRFPVRTFGNL